MSRPYAAFVVMGLLFSISPTSWAQGPGSDDETIKARIQELDSLWLQAYLDDDQEVVRRIVADDFLGVIDSIMYTKEDILRDVASMGPELKSFLGSKRVVTVHGSTAVIRGVGHGVAIREDGSESSWGWRYVDTYVWRDGRWQCVAIAAW